MTNQRRALLKVLALEVEHVRIVYTVCRNHRQLDPAGIGQRLEGGAVGVPCVHAVVVDLVRVEQLRPQVGCIQLTGQIAVAEVHPCVLIDLTAEEFRAVCAFSRRISARSL